jgi:hypothetical protein
MSNQVFIMKYFWKYDAPRAPLTAADVKSLPKPTDSQWLAFENHLIYVHSWYKHLPLFEGGDFVVFLAPDAGDSYPTQHPKLPTENTVQGYRQAFGHLDYMWRTPPSEQFHRDGGLSISSLDDELMTAGRFNLYPYISGEMYWSVHENEIARIRNGDEHEHAIEILKAYDADLQMDKIWESLTDSERTVIDSINDRESATQWDSLSNATLHYLELQDCYPSLSRKEEIKLKAALTQFRYWLG